MFSRDLRPGLLDAVPSGLGTGVGMWSRDLHPGLLDVVPLGLGTGVVVWSRDLHPGLLDVVPLGLGMGVGMLSRDLHPGLLDVVPSGLGMGALTHNLRFEHMSWIIGDCMFFEHTKVLRFKRLFLVMFLLVGDVLLHRF